MTTEITKTNLDLVLTRVFDAPRELVWKAWTDPKHLVNWWGPHGMTTPVVEMDLRPGGRFYTLMRDPDGNEYPTECTFVEIVPNEKLSYRSNFNREGMPKADAVGEITFLDAGPGKTRLIVRWTHDTPETRQHHEKMGFEQGWGETLERLNTEVAKMAGEKS